MPQDVQISLDKLLIDPQYLRREFIGPGGYIAHAFDQSRNAELFKLVCPTDIGRKIFFDQGLQNDAVKMKQFFTGRQDLVMLPQI